MDNSPVVDELMELMTMYARVLRIQATMVQVFRNESGITLSDANALRTISLSKIMKMFNFSVFTYMDGGTIFNITIHYVDENGILTNKHLYRLWDTTNNSITSCSDNERLALKNVIRNGITPFNKKDLEPEINDFIEDYL